MILLSPDSWIGLPIHICDNEQRLHVVNCELGSPVLVLWTFGEATVDVRRNAREHWHFRARAHAFDLYAEGVFDAVTISESPRAMLVLTLPSALTAALLPSTDADLPLKHCRFQFADRPLERLVQALAEHARHGEPSGPLYTRALSASVLKRLVAIQSPQCPEADVDGMSEATCETVRALIESRIAAPPGVSDLALIAGLSLADFVKSFRHAFGQTPHQFVLDMRIAKAKLLLAQDAPLTMLALELGFANHGHFTATFHARTGSTPSDYRRRSREATDRPM